MKTVVIRELDGFHIPGAPLLDLAEIEVKGCLGCWSCWWATPGRCVHHDLDEFYHQYLTADRAVFFARPVQGFVSGNLKSLFDRMIPHFLPYIHYDTGESMHYPRYERYPDIEFYYDGEFKTDEDRQIFEEYIHRVFYQFYSKKIKVLPVACFAQKEGIQK